MNSNIQAALNGKVNNEFMEYLLACDGITQMNRKLLKLIEKMPPNSLHCEDVKKDKVKKRLQQKLLNKK
jgi:hypothetical protein